MDGDSLEAALRDYGPAAIEDLLPRLRVIAAALDEAHRAGRIHGFLHPQNIFISADATRVGGLDSAADAGREAAVRPPYAAPEVAGDAPPIPASDQFALAAIAYEWLFGRRVSGPAARPVEVRTLPGVDRDAMSAAFTRALAPEAANRFASCTAFCDALSASVIPMLPLGSAVADDVLDTGFLPEPAAAPLSEQPDDEPRFDTFEPKVERLAEPVVAWQPAASYSRPKEPLRFSGAMLIGSCLVGMVVGFAAGYMARPRALQSGPIQTMTVPSNGTEAAVAAVPSAPAPGTVARTPAPQAPVAPSNVGRLLVRSTPGGATVDVDGVERGVTPLALRDLELGSRTITITRRGFAAEVRRVVLTAARPSQSLEVPLTAAAAATPRRPAPAEGGWQNQRRPATATGSLVVESRPAGATVLIDGVPRGTTPLTIDALAPADYRVSLSLPGYRTFATTVRVVAGERTRAAASLSVQE